MYLETASKRICSITFPGMVVKAELPLVCLFPPDALPEGGQEKKGGYLSPNITKIFWINLTF